MWLTVVLGRWNFSLRPPALFFGWQGANALGLNCRFGCQSPAIEQPRTPCVRLPSLVGTRRRLTHPGPVRVHTSGITQYGALTDAKQTRDMLVLRRGLVDDKERPS
ncbi:hypothetical protein BD310DRAFT_917820, partial [Dichomitus squalens]